MNLTKQFLYGWWRQSFCRTRECLPDDGGTIPEVCEKVVCDSASSAVPFGSRICRNGKRLCLLLLSLSVSGLLSCKDDPEQPIYLDYLNINSFVINGVEGVIDHKKAVITLNMPMGTSLGNLTPEITAEPGAVVTPASGVAQNFATTQRYTVVNNGRYRVYQVNVTVAKVQITQFDLQGQVGIIDNYGKKIDVYVPVGTSLTGIVPTIKYTEDATLTPDALTEMDFSDSVRYTLSYQGVDYEYTVKVHYGTPYTIFDGETVAPDWWIAGSAGDINKAWDNPKPSPENSTSKCLTVWRNPGDDPWTGGGLSGLNIDPNVYKVFRVAVLKDYAGNVQMEIQGNGAENQYLQQPYVEAGLGEWQILRFELPEDHGFSQIHTVLVAPHIDDTKTDPNFFGHRMYWDQVIAYEN